MTNKEIRLEPLTCEVNMFIGTCAGGKFYTAMRNAKKSIKILSPFMTESEIAHLWKSYTIGGIKDISVIIVASEDDLGAKQNGKAIESLLIPEKNVQGEITGYHLFFEKTVFFKEHFFHAKLYIVDDETAYMGSFNFTKQGMENQCESSFIIKEKTAVEKLCAFYDQVFNANVPKWQDLNELGGKVYKRQAEKPHDGKQGA
jgi:phosphatidylserine/phosphatidylglycerophosphate/cardiolipin synthase-like enzyme